MFGVYRCRNVMSIIQFNSCVLATPSWSYSTVRPHNVRMCSSPFRHDRQWRESFAASCSLWLHCDRRGETRLPSALASLSLSLSLRLLLHAAPHSTYMCTILHTTRVVWVWFNWTCSAFLVILDGVWAKVNIKFTATA